MKGLTHFVVGVATTSFFPAAVAAGAGGNPLFFILGGVFGLLPDTIDFRFRRFFSAHDIQIAPDPAKLDAQVIADGIAGAINEAHATGEAVRIKLHTIPLGPDTWRRYSVRFDVVKEQVAVEYGPAVTTGQTPVDNTEPEGRRRATAVLNCAVRLDYEATSTIDILDGPLFRMTPTADGKVCPEFIAWHRTWSHSIITAFLMAMAVAAAGAVTSSRSSALLMGAVAFAAHAAHILCDQLGHMGSAVLFPVIRKRTAGLRLMHSTEALPNFITIWTCCLLIFRNLQAATSYHIPRFNLLQLVVYGIVIPFGLVALAVRAIQRWSGRGRTDSSA